MTLDEATLRKSAGKRRCYLELDEEGRVVSEVCRNPVVNLAKLLGITPFPVLGKTAEELIRKLHQELDPYGPKPEENLAREAGEDAEDIEEGDEPEDVTLIARLTGDKIRWVRVIVKPGLIEIENNSRIEPLSAYADLLTTLPNRPFLDNELLPRLVLAAKTNSDARGVCALLVDLNGFKPVNDDWGHHIGDMLLQAFSERLKEAAQRDSLESIAIRQGGDEFVIVLPLITYAEVEARVQAISDFLNDEPYRITSGTVTTNTSVTASIGAAWSHCRRKDDDGPSLMRQADQAMYAVKRSRNGSGGYAIFGVGSR